MIWVEWVVLFSKYSGSDAVYMRVSKETAIKFMQAVHPDLSPERALEEFIVVNWASLREDKSDS